MHGRPRLALAIVMLLPLVFSAQRLAIRSDVNGAWDPTGTYSILGYDPRTGEIGGAVQSRVFSVGNGVLWAEAGVGAVATQAIVDVSYGPQGVELLRQGLAPKDVIKKIWDGDPDPQPAVGERANWTKYGRQFAVISTKGEVAAYTGPKATPWAGDRQGRFCTAQGNILAGEAVVTNMIEAFEKTEKDASGSPNHISLRLMAAIEAGKAAGGDSRTTGPQSAAMVVVKKDCGVWLHNDVVLRLQVDDHPEPVQELRRLVDLAARQRRGKQGCF